MKIYSSFCSSSYCHFSGKLIIYTLPKLLSLWAKNCSQCLLQSSRELKFFPLREFCKGKNKVKHEDAMSGEYSGWIRTSQSSYNSFYLVIKEHAVLRYPHGRLCVFCWQILDVFCQVLLLIGLTGSSTSWNCLVFQKELIIDDSHSIPPYSQDQLLWMKTGLCCGWW